MSEQWSESVLGSNCLGRELDLLFEPYECDENHRFMRDPSREILLDDHELGIHLCELFREESAPDYEKYKQLRLENWVSAQVRILEKPGASISSLPVSRLANDPVNTTTRSLWQQMNEAALKVDQQKLIYKRGLVVAQHGLALIAGEFSGVALAQQQIEQQIAVQRESRSVNESKREATPSAASPKMTNSLTSTLMGAKLSESMSNVSSVRKRELLNSTMESSNEVSYTPTTSVEGDCRNADFSMTNRSQRRQRVASRVNRFGGNTGNAGHADAGANNRGQPVGQDPFNGQRNGSRAAYNFVPTVERQMQINWR